MTTPFTNAEYEARQQRARALMAESGLPALLVTDPGNLFYFTGYPNYADMSYPRPATFILPLDGDGVLIVHDFYFPLPWSGDLRTYEKVGALPVALVQAALEEKGCAAGRIGAELGHEQQLGMSYHDFMGLQAALPGADLVDAAHVLWRLRMVKTEAEVANIAEACRIHDRVFARCFADVRVGMTTREIDGLFQRAGTEAGGGPNGAIVCVGPFVPAQAAGSSAPDRALAPGELLWVDYSVGLHGYRTDYCRAVVAGGPSDRQRELWGKVQEVLLVGEAAARPGVTAAEVCRAQLAAAEGLALDMSTWTARRYGHGSGIHLTEPPYLALDDETVLEPGMLIHVEPGCVGEDGIYVREEMVVITDDGCQALSQAPWELGTV